MLINSQRSFRNSRLQGPAELKHLHGHGCRFITLFFSFCGVDLYYYQEEYMVE